MGDITNEKITYTDREVKTLNNYIQNGLTYISDNTKIHPRDEAGNIIFNDGAVDNPILIVEPVRPLYTVESVINVLDTNFEYFKFPVTIDVADDTESLEQLNEEFEASLPENDIIYARYKPANDYVITNGSNFIGIDFDEVYEGVPQKVKNFYTITKDIKESGKDLRFRIKISHRAVKPTDINPANDPNWNPGGYIYWSVNKQGPDLPPLRAYGNGTNGAFVPGVGGGDYYAFSSDIKSIQAVKAKPILNYYRRIIDEMRSRGYWDGAMNGVGLYTYENQELLQYTGEPISIKQLELLKRLNYDWRSISTAKPGENIRKLVERITIGKGKYYGRNLSTSQANDLSSRLSGIRYNFHYPGRDLLVEYENLVNDANLWGLVTAQDGVVVTWMDFVIPNSSFKTGEMFNISANTGNKDGHEIISARSYWVISDASKNVDLFNTEK